MKPQFDIGDKVIVTKNNDVIIFEVDSEDVTENKSTQANLTNDGVVTANDFVEPENLRLYSSKCRLMNGDVFKIKAAGSVKFITKDTSEPSLNGKNSNQEKVKYFVLDDLCGRTLCVEERSLLSKSKLKHAWAITLHKFQGSEAENIVYCLTGSFFENWRFVYTAVTRGRKNVIIVGSYEHLKQAVERKSIPRQTSLREKIRNMLYCSSMETPSKILGSQMEKALGITSPIDSPLKRKSETPEGDRPKKKLF